MNPFHRTDEQEERLRDMAGSAELTSLHERTGYNRPIGSWFLGMRLGTGAMSAGREMGRSSIETLNEIGFDFEDQNCKD